MSARIASFIGETSATLAIDLESVDIEHTADNWANPLDDIQSGNLGSILAVVVPILDSTLKVMRPVVGVIPKHLQTGSSPLLDSSGIVCLLVSRR